MRNLALRLGLKLSPRDDKDPKSVSGLPADAALWATGNAILWDAGNVMTWE